MNRLTDMDSGWWPFLQLRPAKNQEMNNKLLVTMAAYYGPFYGLVFGILESVITHDFSVLVILRWVVFLSFFFFFGSVVSG